MQWLGDGDRHASLQLQERQLVALIAVQGGPHSELSVFPPSNRVGRASYPFARPSTNNCLYALHFISRSCRPFNRILVAQHVTMPQMWISCLVAVQVGRGRLGGRGKGRLALGHAGAQQAGQGTSMQSPASICSMLLARHARAAGVWVGAPTLASKLPGGTG